MAASIDLSDLVEPLQAALNVPGEDIYDTVSPSMWIIYLQNGFWEAYADGLLQGFREDEGEILPISGATAMGKDLQQLVIMYTSIAIIRMRLLNMQTVFRAKAGPVEYEVQYSASVLKALLDDLSERRKFLLDQIVAAGTARGMFYYDSYLARQDALNYGYTSWIGA